MLVDRGGCVRQEDRRRPQARQGGRPQQLLGMNKKRARVDDQPTGPSLLTRMHARLLATIPMRKLHSFNRRLLPLLGVNQEDCQLLLELAHGKDGGGDIEGGLDSGEGGSKRRGKRKSCNCCIPRRRLLASVVDRSRERERVCAGHGSRPLFSPSRRSTAEPPKSESVTS